MFGKYRACVSGDILAYRQTDRQTQRRTHHNTMQQTEKITNSNPFRHVTSIARPNCRIGCNLSSSRSPREKEFNLNLELPERNVI